MVSGESRCRTILRLSVRLHAILHVLLGVLQILKGVQNVSPLYVVSFVFIFIDRWFSESECFEHIVR